MHNELLWAQLEGHTGITSTSQRTSHCVLCRNRAFNDCSMAHGYSLMFDFLSSDYKKSWNYAWYHIAPNHIDSAQRHIKFQHVVKPKKLSNSTVVVEGISLLSQVHRWYLLQNSKVLRLCMLHMSCFQIPCNFRNWWKTEGLDIE